MIRKVEGFGRYVAIRGFRDVHIVDVECFLTSVRQTVGDAVVQFLDAKLVAGWEHLYFATLNALKAFDNQTNISKNLAVECILYASARRQIKAAFEVIGIRENLSTIAVLIIADSEEIAAKALKRVENLISGKHDDSVLDLTKKKTVSIKALFGISDMELGTKLEVDEGKALSELVIEHIALLVTQR